MIKILGKITSF